MKIIARKTGSDWDVSEDNEGEILKKNELVTFLKGNGYSVSFKGNSIIVSDVPEEDFLANIIDDFYGDSAEVYPF